jgi:hypothetical protein
MIACLLCRLDLKLDTFDFDVLAAKGMCLRIPHLFPFGSDADFFTEHKALFYYQHLLKYREHQCVPVISGFRSLLNDPVYRDFLDVISLMKKGFVNNGLRCLYPFVDTDAPRFHNTFLDIQFLLDNGYDRLVGSDIAGLLFANCVPCVPEQVTYRRGKKKRSVVLRPEQALRNQQLPTVI